MGFSFRYLGSLSSNMFPVPWDIILSCFHNYTARVCTYSIESYAGGLKHGSYSVVFTTWMTAQDTLLPILLVKKIYPSFGDPTLCLFCVSGSSDVLCFIIIPLPSTPIHFVLSTNSFLFSSVDILLPGF